MNKWHVTSIMATVLLVILTTGLVGYANETPNAIESTAMKQDPVSSTTSLLADNPEDQVANIVTNVDDSGSQVIFASDILTVHLLKKTNFKATISKDNKEWVSLSEIGETTGKYAVWDRIGRALVVTKNRTSVTGITDNGDLVTDSMGTLHLSGIHITQIKDRGSEVEGHHTASLEFLRTQYVGKSVLVHQEKGQNAQVFLQDGVNIAIDMLQSGYASVELPTSEKARIQPYLNAFTKAVSEGKGIWQKK